MRRGIQQAITRRIFDDAPRIEHQHPIAESGHQRQVVADEQQCPVVPMGQSFEQRQDLGLDRHVERGRCFIGDQQIRLVRQGHGNGHTLTLATRELVRETPLDIGDTIQSDPLEQRLHALGDLRAGRA